MLMLKPMAEHATMCSTRAPMLMLMLMSLSSKQNGANACLFVFSHRSKMAALCYKSLFSSRNGGDSMSLLFLETKWRQCCLFLP